MRSGERAPRDGWRARSKTPTAAASAAEDEDFGERERVGMRDGQERRSPADRGKAPGGAAVKLELRWSSVAKDLDVVPVHSLRMAGAESLHGGFLRGEAGCEAHLRHPVAPAVGHFTSGKHAMHEPIAIARDGVGNAGDIRDVKAETDDVRQAGSPSGSASA